MKNITASIRSTLPLEIRIQNPTNIKEMIKQNLSLAAYQASSKRAIIPPGFCKRLKNLMLVI